MPSSREVLRRLQADGWKIVRIRGDHHQLQHPSRPGTVTVQHPRKDLDIKVVRSIERQSGLKLH
ncbi:MAG TPA: type II toxin-antitoxin system HicA family toxin [Geminicoccaceae bacterium]|nr:type II toxin-antitoxin system HicA family toxin [Geminicoccaceae bacterium]